MKTAIYMRVGNKEQLNSPNQENRIPTPEELAADGYEVLTLPKKKASKTRETLKKIPTDKRRFSKSVSRCYAPNAKSP